MKTQPVTSMYLKSLAIVWCFCAISLQGAVILTDTFSTLDGAWTVDLDADLNTGVLFIQSDGTDLEIREDGAQTGNDNLGTLTRTFSTAGFETIGLDLDLRQGRSGGTFEGTEFFRVEADTGSGYTLLYEDFGVLDQGADVTGSGGANTGGITTGVLNLDAGADNGSFDLRLSFQSGFYDGASFSEVYFLENLELTGTAIPEPSTTLLLGFGGIAVIVLRKRK